MSLSCNKVVCICLLLLAALTWKSVAGTSVNAAAVTPTAQPTPVSSADASCKSCHRGIVESYLKTTMAIGSGVAADGLIPGSFTHSRSGATYHVDSAPDGPLLTYQVPSKGVEARQQLLYYLGSGNLGRTYLYNIDGYLLESPVAYLSSLHGYAMAPGLAQVSAVPSALPMNALCMRCHMSDVQKPLPGEGNRFAGLPFLHGGITCEQCHGDTTLHVQSKGKLPAINPARLSAPVRDSVCISCHLEGDTNVELRGKSVFDYKVGDDIRQYLTYFVVPSNSGRAVTEVEQLNQSVCKRKSGDHMSCMSCHDPHSRPEPDQRVAFYRAKCLACHTGAVFATAHHPENQDCTSCHMPKSEVRDTPHVAWTDHRILKLPALGGSGNTNAVSGQLVPALSGEEVTSRELGLAYYNLFRAGDPKWAVPALSNLEDARAKEPSDDAVEISLAAIYQQEGRSRDARRLYEEALKSHPDNVEATSNLAILLARQGDLTTAQSLLERTFEHAQDQETLGLNLAVTDCMQGNAAAAKAVLNTVLQFSPASVRAREQLRSVARNGCH